MSLSYPEVLALAGPRSFHAFLDQYQKTLLWSETLDDDTPLDSSDIEVVIHESTYLTLTDDSLRFLRDFFQSTDPAIVKWREGTGNLYMLPYSVFQSLAHDLVLSRNGHGSGFWDGDWDIWKIPGLGDALHALAKSQGERHLHGVRVDEEEDRYLVHVL